MVRLVDLLYVSRAEDGGLEALKGRRGSDAGVVEWRPRCAERARTVPPMEWRRRAEVDAAAMWWLADAIACRRSRRCRGALVGRVSALPF